MKLADAENWSKALMEAHGLQDWDFAFDRGTRRLGACHTNLRKITLSKAFVKLNKWSEVQETMFHEIAHALTGDGHTRRWRGVYGRIGGNPNRSYANLVSAHKKRSLVTGHCPNCNKKVQARIRSATACKECCVKYNNGRYTDAYKFIWEEKK